MNTTDTTAMQQAAVDTLAAAYDLRDRAKQSTCPAEAARLLKASDAAADEYHELKARIKAAEAAAAEARPVADYTPKYIRTDAATLDSFLEALGA